MIWRRKDKARQTQTFVAVCLALLTACASEPKQVIEPESPTKDLPADTTPATTLASRAQAREKAIEAYRDYLARYPAAPERNEIKRRLADLLMARAVDATTANPDYQSGSTRPSSTTMQDYADAIAIYEELLVVDPQANQPELRYQLARAYEEMGEASRAVALLDRLIEYSRDVDTKLYADAQFRRGELFFEEGSFVAAERSFREVIRVRNSTGLYERALYKLGWSLFKQERYDDSLEVFFTLLDLKIPVDADPATHLASLSRAEQEQLADVFRAVNLAFSNLSGVDSVVAHFARNGSRAYEAQVYRNLAEFYGSKEFYTDAAKTYLALAQRYPNDGEAPRLYIKVITLYENAGLRQNALESEEAFVQRYGLDAAFWQGHAPQAFPDVVERLQKALIDLAGHYHARAREQGARTDRRAAERWYRAYLASFGDAEGAPKMNLELAALLRENGEYEQSVVEYERTAYSRGNHRWAAEAGRSALLVYEQRERELKGEERDRWSRRSTASAVRFVEVFPQDSDAPVVLSQAGVDMLDRGEAAEAIHVSETVLTTAEPAPEGLRQTAWSILAQVNFGQGNYKAAENAYQEALAVTEPNDPRRSALKEGMASAIYKQGTERLAEGNEDQAVADFLRAANAAPSSPVGPEAQYDAAASLLALEAWEDAARILEQFRADYPEHRLQEQATQKLAFAYARSGRKVDAAAEYLRLGRKPSEAALRREALLRAADLYEESGRPQDAAVALEIYVTEFKSPAGETVEIFQRLADLERSVGDETARRAWLGKVITAERSAGSARNTRTRTLAARASMELAEDRVVSFHRIRLVEPLKDSFEIKLAEMKLALKALEEVTDYRVAPVTSEAIYKIADMYDELASALRESQRPKNLSLEETAQYDLLLEKEAAPLEQRAIEYHEANVLRIPKGHYDRWIERSLARLAELWPVRYARNERSEASAYPTQGLVTGTRNPLAFNELGIEHRRAGRFEQARAAYERALKLRPDYSTAHLNLGILCELYLQHRDCAMRQYEAYQRLSNAADPEVKLWIEDLRKRAGPK